MQIFAGKWSNDFDGDKCKANLDNDAFKSNKLPLLPGRFYVLRYMSKIKEPFNTRPVIISLGLSKKDPESFLCIDLCVIPKDIRIKVIEKYFQIFYNDIKPSFKYIDVKDADKQKEVKMVTYQNLMKVKDFEILKPAIKRYKIKDMKTIYSILFCDVYKFIGKFADENMYLNGKIGDIQKDYLEKIKKIK